MWKAGLSERLAMMEALWGYPGLRQETAFASQPYEGMGVTPGSTLEREATGL